MQQQYLDMAQRLADQCGERVYLLQHRQDCVGHAHDYLIYAVLESQADAFERYNSLMVVEPSKGVARA